MKVFKYLCNNCIIHEGYEYNIAYRAIQCRGCGKSYCYEQGGTFDLDSEIEWVVKYINSFGLAPYPKWLKCKSCGIYAYFEYNPIYRNRYRLQDPVCAYCEEEQARKRGIRSKFMLLDCVEYEEHDE